jgi:2-polyprenyl-6-methoxyphenol hydroxylase-like FAD-dependent oxidoreductase
MRIFGDSGKLEDGIHFSSFEANLPHLAYIVESEQISRALDLASSFTKYIERKTALFENIHFDDGQAYIKTNIGSFNAPLVIAADGANSLDSPTITH